VPDRLSLHLEDAMSSQEAQDSAQRIGMGADSTCQFCDAPVIDVEVICHTKVRNYMQAA
jgi:hypothetical protein